DTKDELMIVVCNFTPAVRYSYRLGVPFRGQWKEVFNSDDQQYGGSGVLNRGILNTSPVKFHGRDYYVSLNLPPLAVTILKLDREVSEFELQDISTCHPVIISSLSISRKTVLAPYGSSCQ